MTPHVNLSLVDIDDVEGYVLKSSDDIKKVLNEFLVEKGTYSTSSTLIENITYQLVGLTLPGLRCRRRDERERYSRFKNRRLEQLSR